jgi:hypothetical protein
MYWQYGMSKAEKQAERRLSLALTQQLLSFLDPLLKQLDHFLDKRLIRTLLDTVIAILLFRDRAKNLLLSELGAYIASPTHAPAGTKRLSNLLRSVRWEGRLIEHFLWQRATDSVEAMECQGETPLVLWDESKLEGLGSVSSSKGNRLTHLKPGFYQPPKGTACSGGPIGASLEALGAVRAGWWLGRCMHAWGRRVVHVFDRGFAGEPWLEECMQYTIRFVMRWPKGYMLRDFQWIKRKAWQITRGKRSQWKRQLYNRHLNAWVQGSVVVVPVTHPQVRGQFWLVVSRPGKGQLPWYLLTNEPIQTEENAWGVCSHTPGAGKLK